MDVQKTEVVALAADLIFAARIRSAAEAAHVSISLSKDVGDFLTNIEQHKPRLAILDLDRRGLAVGETIQKVRGLRVPVLAYVSHVREDLIAEARAAGADRVMPRGAFAKHMVELLRGEAKPRL